MRAELRSRMKNSRGARCARKVWKRRDDRKKHIFFYVKHVYMIAAYITILNVSEVVFGLHISRPIHFRSLRKLYRTIFSRRRWAGRYQNVLFGGILS